MNWAKILKTNKPKPIKKVIVKKKEIKSTELNIEEKRYNNFIDKFETDIIDLLFDLEKICEDNAVYMLNNKKRGYYTDFVNLIAGCVILPQLDEEYNNDDDEEDEIDDYINYDEY
tara:strand:- start:385 stop:729 length:345 start_codon:yes stop_codon:yes gene_type:complete